MKKIIVSIILLVGIGMVVAPSTDADFSVTVSNRPVLYGAMATSTSKSTIDLNDTQTATNNGTENENFNIKGQYSAPGGWILAGTVGEGQYVHKFCNDTDNDCVTPPTNYTALTTEYAPLDTNIAVDGSVDFQLQITTPAVSTSTVEQHVDVTIQAVAP